MLQVCTVTLLRVTGVYGNSAACLLQVCTVTLLRVTGVYGNSAACYRCVR